MRSYHWQGGDAEERNAKKASIRTQKILQTFHHYGSLLVYSHLDVASHEMLKGGATKWPDVGWRDSRPKAALEVLQSLIM